ncbi:MAG: type II toxin-antitoxin system VapC family toxin [Propionibacteriaceae bacterium]|nr:type II toxin-antitoxin system VapC family toxin [Propionibacteriaceae bacterium]
MSLVIDASALIEVLLDTDIGKRVEPFLQGHSPQIHAPEIVAVEIISTLRRLVRRGTLTMERANEAITDFQQLPLELWPLVPLMDRVWVLRDAVSAYDATYVALAEELGAVFLTSDERLARGCQGIAQCSVELVSQS